MAVAVAAIIMMGFFVGLAVAATVFMFIGMWKTAKKMGEPGWKGIIPFYNMYVFFTKVWDKKFFWLWLGIWFVNLAFGILQLLVLALDAITSNGNISTSTLTAGSLGGIAIIGLNAIMMCYMAASFRQKGWWAVLAAVLPGIYFIYLGFSKKTFYYGNASLYDAFTNAPRQWTYDELQNYYRVNNFQQNNYNQNVQQTVPQQPVSTQPNNVGQGQVNNYVQSNQNVK